MADTSRALESCADYTRGGRSPAPDHDASLLSRKSRVEEEQRRLVLWAESNNALKRRRGISSLPEFARGGEHAVYYSRANRRYYKATLPERKLGYGLAFGSHVQGAGPSEYLDRLILHNRIFDDDVRLEYVLANNGFPIIVTSQPGVKGVSPSQDAIDELMRMKGFEGIAPGAYYEDMEGLLIFDLFPRNAILAEDGTIYPIDPVIQRIDCDFADFLREDPGIIARLS